MFDLNSLGRPDFHVQGGDIVEIRNGYPSLFKRFLRLNIGRRGTAQKVDKEVGEVNRENNLSERRQVCFSYWVPPSRRPYRRRRRY